MKASMVQGSSKGNRPEAMRERRTERRYGFYERGAAPQRDADAVYASEVSRPVSRADYYRLFD